MKAETKEFVEYYGTMEVKSDLPIYFSTDDTPIPDRGSRFQMNFHVYDYLRDLWWSIIPISRLILPVFERYPRLEGKYPGSFEMTWGPFWVYWRGK